ncbi:MAG: glycosyltransferase family 4 protein [Magnetococcus sp. DMHC-1]|nr:glycosyltransferase family 4 protein [Magnetococcales bacterium]
MPQGHIVMAGTAPDQQGGVAAVVRIWQEAGLFDQWPILFLPTHKDGHKLKKLLVFVVAIWRFRRMLATENVALLHVLGASRASFRRKSLLIRMALARGVPVLYHLHGGGFADWYQESPGKTRQAITTLLEQCQQVVALSESWVTRIQEIAPTARVVVVPNPTPPGVSVENVVREPATLLFLGRLEPQKGVYDLIRAVAPLRHRFPHLRLILAGAGDRQGVLTALQTAGMADQSHLPGWVAGTEKARLLAQAGIFVLPSHMEGVPISILEAMAEGIPVVASRVGGVPDLLTDGLEGRMIPPENIPALTSALAELLDNPLLAQQMGQAGQKRAAQHAPEKIVQQLGAIYHGLGIAQVPIHEILE